VTGRLLASTEDEVRQRPLSDEPGKIHTQDVGYAGAATDRGELPDVRTFERHWRHPHRPKRLSPLNGHAHQDGLKHTTGKRKANT
jgi:hypothetical protein